MIDQYIRQLSSNDPAERRAAIIALGKSRDERALRPLSNVIKTDPDESLRALALKAGRHIKGLDTRTTLPAPGEQPAPSNTARKPSSSTNLVFTELPDIDAPMIQPLPGTLTPAFGELSPAPVEKPRRVPSAQDKKLAKGKLDQAIGYKMQGNNEKARASLIEALRRDPDLATDVVALNLAANVGDIKTPQEAMDALMKEAESQPLRGGGFNLPSLRTAQGSIDPAVWNLALEIVIFIVVAIVFGIVVNLGLLNALGSLMRFAPGQTEDTIMLQEMVRSISLSSLLLSGAKSGIVFAVTTVFAIGVSYIIGALRGGSGDMFHFLSALIRVEIVFNLLQVLFLGLMVAGLLLPGSGTPMLALIAAGGILFALSGFAEWLAMGYFASRVHQFSMLRGLFIVTVGSILAGFLWNLFGVFAG
jgi:hypothetical protein